MKTKNTIFFLSFIFLSQMSYSQNGWQQQYVPGSAGYTDIFMLNSNTGWVTGGTGNIPAVYKTTNGGTNWIQYATLPGNYINAVWFKNDMTGWVCGRDIDTLYENVIFKTTNSGINWSMQVHSGFGIGFTDICINQDSSGWCVCPVDDAYRTSDYGNSWIAYPPGFGNEPNEIFFINSTKGWMALGGETGSILGTTNGGNNWVAFTTQWIGYNSVHFVNENIGWAAGHHNDQYGVISKTTNGGVNWQHQFYYNFSEIATIFFPDSIHGWMAAGNTIYVSANGGISWQSQLITGEIRKFWFIDSLVGWAVGYNALWKTTTGGVLFLEPISSEIPNQFSLSQNYPNPFNPVTKIKFSIPAPLFFGEGPGVRLLIYDILGREVATLVNSKLKPGTYEVDFDGSNYASGIYFYQLNAGEFTETKRMVLIK